MPLPKSDALLQCITGPTGTHVREKKEKPSILQLGGTLKAI